tara:strand:- start:260 stop:466 length:207 start_codon:yes stop_codon:yes gene_type:complete
MLKSGNWDQPGRDIKVKGIRVLRIKKWALALYSCAGLSQTVVDRIADGNQQRIIALAAAGSIRGVKES